MEKIEFEHGGKEYDAKYPDGIPTSIQITTASGKTFDSGLVMYPGGHARNTSVNLNNVLDHKFNLLGKIAITDNQLQKLLKTCGSLETLTNKDL